MMSTKEGKLKRGRVRTEGDWDGGVTGGGLTDPSPLSLGRVYTNMFVFLKTQSKLTLSSLCRSEIVLT